MHKKESKSIQIKSRDRVRDLAEVYTNEREVNAMLDLIPLNNPDKILRMRYLEPACGNGNFLIEILRRKLSRANALYAHHKGMREYEFQIAKAITFIYGIDICIENVLEARERLYSEIKSTVDLHKGSFVYSEGFFPLVRMILEKNIVRGDSINGPQWIEMTEYRFKGRQIAQRVFNFADLTQTNPEPIRELPMQHFLSLGIEYQLKTGCENEGIQRHLNLV